MSLFYCIECERKTPDGKGICGYVVMDGTATGILGVECLSTTPAVTLTRWRDEVSH